jgi:hypothetical protein
MVKIYDDMLDVIRMLKPIVDVLRKHDGDLAGRTCIVRPARFVTA